MTPTRSLVAPPMRVSLNGGPGRAALLTLDPGPGESPLFGDQPGLPIEVVVDGHVFSSESFVATELTAIGDALVGTYAVHEELLVRLAWTREESGALGLQIQLRGPHRIVPVAANVKLRLGLSKPWKVLDQPRTSGGRPLVRSISYPLPTAIVGRRRGISLMCIYAAGNPLSSNEETSTWQPMMDSFRVRLSSDWADACQLVFRDCEPTWLGAFLAFRAEVRSRLDLTQYARVEQAWLRDQWLQHFAFLYGAEAFDHRHQRLDSDHLLGEGQEYGHYDSTLVWPGYPRLGVDERSQWDFFDDLPGGRDGLRSFIRACRDRGVRVFVPYLPWDSLQHGFHGIPSEGLGELAKLVADVRPDGVFLDTIAGVPTEFRHALDEVDPGIVFCSEEDPGQSDIEIVTSSWDQAEHSYSAEIDLLRFLFPEHRRYVVSRYAVGRHREQVIDRALFNGSGLVVWQDIFGEVLPYLPDEIAKVARVKQLLSSCHAFYGGDALPLVPTANPDCFANAFIDADGRAVVTVCNDGDATADGELVAWSPDEHIHWYRSGPEEGARSDRPLGPLAPGEVAVFVSERT